VSRSNADAARKVQKLCPSPGIRKSLKLPACSARSSPKRKRNWLASHGLAHGSIIMATRLEHHLCRPVERVHRAYRAAARLPPLCDKYPVCVRLASLCFYAGAKTTASRSSKCVRLQKRLMLSPCEVLVSGEKPNHCEASSEENCDDTLWVTLDLRIARRHPRREVVKGAHHPHSSKRLLRPPEGHLVFGDAE
jgi:hypothetical protein